MSSATPERPRQPRATTTTKAVEHALARHREKYQDEVQRLLDATLVVMREQETADPTVNDILSVAGVSTSVFYRHFPTKGDLLVTLLEQAHELTAAHLEQRLETVEEPRRRIEAWVRALFDLVRSEESLRQNRALLLAHPRLLQEFPHEISTGFAILSWPVQVAISDARSAEELPAGDAAMDARLALSHVFGILVDAAALGAPPTAELIDAVVTYTTRAVLGPTTQDDGLAPGVSGPSRTRRQPRQG